MRSPHALSRGNAALSTRATRAPPCAKTSAAMLPAGPDPTTSTSKRLSVITSPSSNPELYGHARGGPTADNDPRSQPLRPELVPAAPASLRPARRTALAGTEPALETRDGLARRWSRSAGHPRCRHRHRGRGTRAHAPHHRTDNGYRHQ